MVQQSRLALELGIELSPDLFADSLPGLVLELALDVALELARSLDLESQFSARTATAFAPPGKDEVMKKLIAVVALCLAVSSTSFGAEHVVTRSAKAVGKGTYKAAKVSVKETTKALKFLF